MSERQNGFELVAEAITEYYGERCDEDEPGCVICDAWAWLEAAVTEREARQAVEAAQALRVEVKPLEWENFGAFSHWSQNSHWTYRIECHGGIWSWTVDDEETWLHGKIADSEDAAKAAAQADYEARIRSALVVPPGKDREP